MHPPLPKKLFVKFSKLWQLPIKCSRSSPCTPQRGRHIYLPGYQHHKNSSVPYTMAQNLPHLCPTFHGFLYKQKHLLTKYFAPEVRTQSRPKIVYPCMTTSLQFLMAEISLSSEDSIHWVREFTKYMWKEKKEGKNTVLNLTVPTGGVDLRLWPYSQYGLEPNIGTGQFYSKASCIPLGYCEHVCGCAKRSSTGVQLHPRLILMNINS